MEPKRSNRPHLLIVDDDEAIRSQMKWAFADEYEVAFAWDAESVLKQMEQAAPAVVTLDLGLPPDPRNASEGLRLLREILRKSPATQVIVITGNPDKENALKAIELGATDFYSKPVDLDELRVSIRRSAHIQRMSEELARSREQAIHAMGRMVAQSSAMSRVFQLIRKAAPTDEPVLILGESGTGKELVARAIHEESLRAKGPFVPVNCGGIPETLIEGELFGHEAGAFTDAKKRRLGLVEQAVGGTLFLDEIGELPLAMQPKLLRFLQSGAIQRLGSGKEFSVNVRVIAATHRDLAEEIRQGRFREDLYYRLCVVQVAVPPLRARKEDITILADLFLKQAETQAGRGRLAFADQVPAMLAEYGWPGNVRELENRIRSAVILAEDGEITAENLGLAGEDLSIASLREVREAAERAHIQMTLAVYHGNISRAAKALDISRPTLHALIQKLGIEHS